MSSTLQLRWRKYLAYVGVGESPSAGDWEARSRPGALGSRKTPWSEAWEARSGPYALHVYTDRTRQSRVGVRGAWSKALTLEPRADVVDAMREAEALFLGELKEWADTGVCPTWLLVRTEYTPTECAPAPSARLDPAGFLTRVTYAPGCMSKTSGPLPEARAGRSAATQSEMLTSL